MSSTLDDTIIEARLSPSAKAVLQAVREIEDGREADVFQDGPDRNHLRMMTKTFRGSMYSALTKRLAEVIDMGGVSVVTQSDLMSLAADLWNQNASRLSETEVAVIRGATESPGLALNDLAMKVGLSYPQARRAHQRLRECGVLRVSGSLNLDTMGLERILLVMKSPQLVLTGPYIEKMLFVDGSSPTVYLVAVIAREQSDNLLHLVRSLRGDAEGIFVWRLSAGKLGFSDLYLNTKTGSWEPDILHFRLMLRGGGPPIVLGDAAPVPQFRVSYTPADLTMIDQLRDNYMKTANEIVGSTGLSGSTAFRKRQQILNSGIILPRPRVHVPSLCERIIVILPPDLAGDVLPAWSVLPVTYVSRVSAIEDASQERVLLLAAVPRGFGRVVVGVLSSELSRVEDHTAHVVSSGSDGSISMAAMFDRRSGTWKWSQGDFFDVRPYSIVRREVDDTSLPLDLA